MGLARFMATGTGPGLRLVAGVVLIGVGIAVRGEWGVAPGPVGLLFLLVGATNVCLIAPMARAPLRGSAAARIN